MTIYSPQPHVLEDVLHQSLPARVPRELSWTEWPAGTRAWLCQPTREPMGCEEPVGLAQPTTALCFSHSPRMQPAAAQSQLQKERGKPEPAGSKGCWHQDDTTAQGHCTTGRTGSSWPCWSLSCQHSQAASSLSEHPQRYFWEKGDLQLSAGISPSSSGFQGHSAALGAD